MQILCALCYLHGENPSKRTYVHRDLKPSNVFFKDGIAKVGDFGLVKDWSGDTLTGMPWMNNYMYMHVYTLLLCIHVVVPSVVESTGSSRSPLASSLASSYYASRGGTPLYLSPEQWAKKRSDEKVDMYALGLILFELLCPMATTSEKIEVVAYILS